MASLRWNKANPRVHYLFTDKGGSAWGYYCASLSKHRRRRWKAVMYRDTCMGEMETSKFFRRYEEAVKWIEVLARLTHNGN